MTSQESVIARDSMGFEDIDEFWDTVVAPIAYPVLSEKKVSAASSKRRSSVDLNVSQNTAEIFDYDTSDSIEEEEEEVETAAEEEEVMDPVNVSVQSGRSRKSVINDTEDEKFPKKDLNRSSRRSIGGRYSNITMESSLGGTLPLEDSDDENVRRPNVKDAESERMSLDSLYDKRSSAGSEMIRNDDKIKSRNTVLGRGSVNSIRDGARGRMGTGTSSGTPGKNDRKNVKDFELRGVGEEKDADGYKSDDTADMSAIPRDQNNQNESLGSAASMDFNQNEIGENIYDSNAFLSDSDVDRASEKKKESSGKKGRRDSRSGSRSNVKPNRRVSFGEGTKEHLEEEEENEEGAGGEEENDGLSANGSFTVVFDGDNNGTDDNMESSGLGSRRSSVAATPVSRSRAGSSSGGKYSMGETPGSNEFTRGRVEADETFLDDQDDDEPENSDSDDDDDALGDSYVEDTSFIKAVKNRIQRKNGGGDGRRDSRASTDQEEEEEEEEEEEGVGRGNRRSSRITKGKRLAYWRGERPVYQKGRMVGLLIADKTPAKPPKKTVALKKRKQSNSRVDNTDSEGEGNSGVREIKKLKKDEVEAKIVLPKNLKYLKRESSDEMSIWDDPSDATVTLKVLCHAESLRPLSALPVTGFVVLPAGAIKDAEGVGDCSQVFFVSECQDGAVELGIADPREDEWRDDVAQRSLLRKGDSFFIPPGNIYRLENHSSSTSCTLFWAIVRPLNTVPTPEASSQSPTQLLTTVQTLAR